jgi:hypothetical protein
MSTTVPADWTKSQQVPTSTVTIKGPQGSVVATFNIIGKVDSMSTNYPYKTISTPT